MGFTNILQGFFLLPSSASSFFMIKWSEKMNKIIGKFFIVHQLRAKVKLERFIFCLSIHQFHYDTESSTLDKRKRTTRTIIALEIKLSM